MRTKRDQMIEREHVSRNWLGFRDFSSTKLWEFVTYLSRKWEFVTFMSRKIRISWLLYHEKWRFRDLFVTKNGDCVTYLSWKMGLRDFYVTKNEDFMTSISREFGILWRMCHETKLFKSRNNTFSWHISHVEDQWLL